MAWNRLLVVSLATLLGGCASQPPSVAPRPESSGQPAPDRVWFTGSSNIRNFTCNARQVYVSAEAAPEDVARTRADGAPAVRNAAVGVPVRSLDCGIGLQNSHLFQTLRAGAYPAISFVLSDYSVERAGDARRVSMTGAVMIAGVQKEVAMNGTLDRDKSGRWRLSGEGTINMRDFGVAPPRPFLGLLRVRDEISVHFDVGVRPLVDPMGVLVSLLQ